MVVKAVRVEEVGEVEILIFKAQTFAAFITFNHYNFLQPL